MDQAVRNRLRNVVTQCRRLLEDATAQALQGRFGIYATGRKDDVHVEDDSRMGHLTDEDRALRRDLLDHLEHIKAVGLKPREALEQLVREIAFTHLNRLCAYKMMEARGLIREAVSRGLKSQGFFFYLADHPEDEKLHKGGQQDAAYRNFLDSLGGTLSEEIGVLFNPNDPANRLYPPQRVLDEVLDLINGDDLAGIWTEDETIGWVYQYFTPKELRDKARKESQAPRNSYELAFRNQFYTPRYVVEFLTDNTLGRTWYEMRRGETSLKDRCRYLVRRPTEVFLTDGQEPPPEANQVRDDLSQEELLKQPVYVPHRPQKDPREIRILDPACGSGHFLLYCFDLLQVIYEEAYNDTDLGAALRRDYPALADLRRTTPGLILKHNLHGIDIDLRATQIAALALWLRCQRAYQQLGLKNSERPKITQSHFVCAEPMPGETDLLREFTATLQPRVLGQLVETIFEKMKLAGEAGSLLKIEEEIRQAARDAKDEFIAWKKHQDKAKGHLFPEMVKRDQPNLLDFADLGDEAFLDRVEEEIVEALRRYATQAENGRGFRRRLFADDAGQGFAFIDLCRGRYDVVLMNPPFGEPTWPSRDFVRQQYPTVFQDVLGCFVLRGISSLTQLGRLGAITNRTGLFIHSFSQWRTEALFQSAQVDCVADLGHGVLDEALVEAAAYCIEKAQQRNRTVTFVGALAENDKAAGVRDGVMNLCNSDRSARRHVYVARLCEFDRLPGRRLAYATSPRLRQVFTRLPALSEQPVLCRSGLCTGDDFRFVRLWFECPNFHSGTYWCPFAKGGEYSPYAGDIHLRVNWSHEGADMELSCPGARVQNSQFYFLDGITYSVRTTSSFSPRVLPKGVIFSHTGNLIRWEGRNLALLALLMSRPFAYFLELFMAAADAVTSGSAARSYQLGLLEQIPVPEASGAAEADLSGLCCKVVDLAKAEFLADEGTLHFVVPSVLWFPTEKSLAERLTAFLSRDNARVREMLAITHELDRVCSVLYGIGESEQAEVDELLGPHPGRRPTRALSEERFVPAYCAALEDLVRQVVEEGGANRFATKKTYFANRRIELLCALFDANYAAVLDKASDLGVLSPEQAREGARDVLSYLLGVVFGRWDIRFATGQRQPPPLPHPFAPLPVCPPGMLQGSDGLPAKPEDVPPDYPVAIDWDGILVDDPEHADDIVHRVRDVLEVIWKDRAEAVEKEACEILGVRELRDYFRKPTNGGFWMDHVRRYSKSRRKAPIYWYLRSTKGNYGLWLYYHRLDKDILFKALLNYVEPKIRLEEDRLNTLRARREAAGKSGREAKQVAKDIDRQEQFVAELQDFRDKLRRAADLRIAPDLNDGVVLNIAPLWELVPWKEAKHYWEALQEGKYDWSHIAYQLWPDRVKEKCRTDRSIAIAHGLEDLCEAPPPKRKRAPAADEVSYEEPEEADMEEVDVEP